MRIKNQLGCFTWPAVLATLVTFFAITATLFTRGQGLFSPGLLNAQEGAPLGNITSHAQISAACEKCHAAPWDAAPMAERCMDCHAGIRLELTDPHKFHGILLGNQAALECSACHREHRGSEASLTDVTLNKFPHELLGFATTSHKKIPDGSPFICQTCHVDGYKTFTTSDCANCHIRLDRAFMVTHLSEYAPDCRACHDGKESIDKNFKHPETASAPVGAHTELTCAKCHAGAHLLVDFKTPPAKCADCHLKDNPHGEKLGTVCEDCHNQNSWKDAKFDHALSGFALTGRHEKIACEKCHTTPGQFMDAPSACMGCHQKDDKHAGSEGSLCENCHTTADWKTSTFNHDEAFKLVGAHTGATCAQCHTTPFQFKGAPTTCIGCHQKDDKHAGSEGTACENCHTLSSWKPSTFNHDNAIFKLTGAHVNAQCAKCHTVPVFKGAPTACVGCHLKNDVHKGSLGSGCSSCHTTNAWKPSTFNHNNTGFKLTGLHASAQCAQCHINGVFKGTPSACFSCHQNDDRHAGTEGTACENCHTSAGWKPSSFNHNNAAFPLTGAHVNAQCAKCHTTPGMFKGAPTDCYACHASDDAHGGAFGTSCSLCHIPAAWKPSTFDHNQSAFPLTGAHQSQACSACHINGVYKGTPTACAGCHTEPAYHAGLFGTNCATCHSTSDWKGTYSGPHNFPMRHGSSDGTCATCHPSMLGQWTCFNCHNQSETAAHHAEKGITDISNCLQCHPTGRKP